MFALSLGVLSFFGKDNRQWESDRVAYLKHRPGVEALVSRHSVR